MATSATTLETIVTELCKLSTDGEFDKNKALELLAAKDLLPKKLIPSKNSKFSFASKVAQEFAEENNLSEEELSSITGSAKNCAITKADIKKFIDKPKLKTTNASKQAIELANRHGILITSITGSGTNGNITVKDVQKAIKEKESDDDDLNISQAAKLYAMEKEIPFKDLSKIKGTGTSDRILKSDVEKYLSDNSHSDESGSSSEDDD
jgi:pyruvate/2-oxoglutarate dehydrogenase complex dihydrolipoamide acyltransferase (E2) component